MAFVEFRSYSGVDLIKKRGWDQYLPKAPEAAAIPPVTAVAAVVLNVVAADEGGGAVTGFFAPRRSTQAAPAPVLPLTTAAVGLAAGPPQPTAVVGLNETAAVQYDVMADLLDADMFKVYSDMLRSETLRIQQRKPTKFGYLPMMAVATLGVLNAESFCERVLSCLKLVVTDLHVRLKADEIRMLVMLRMNREFMEYMRATYPDTPLSDFKAADTYVREHGGLDSLHDEDEE